MAGQSPVIELFAKIDATGSADKRYGDGKPGTGSTTKKVDAVEALVLSQKDRSGTTEQFLKRNR